MIKWNKLCNVCKVAKTNKALTNRIYNCASFMRNGESMRAIADDYEGVFTYENLKNHTKKHQFISQDDYTKRHLNQIVKTAEKNIVKRNIESGVVWDTVINKAMERLENDELQIKASDLLKAAKDKSDHEFKVKDQQIAMMEMVYHFASGENNRENVKPYDRAIIESESSTSYDPTEGTTESPESGADGSSGVYYPPTWDAATQGTDQVPAGNDTSQNAY